MVYHINMRYTHGLKIIRQKKHVVKLSLLISLALVLAVVLWGFRVLDVERFYVGFVESLIRVVVAYVIAITLGIAAVLVAMMNKQVEDVAIPILDVLQSFPSFALFPFLVLYLGKTSLVIVVILAIEMFWPVVFTLLGAYKQLRPDLLEAAHVYGAHGSKLLRFVLLPLLFPAVVTGSIVAWGEAWETIIAAEIIINLPGVGSYLSSSQNGYFWTVGMLTLLALLFIINKYLWLPLLNVSTRFQTD